MLDLADNGGLSIIGASSGSYASSPAGVILAEPCDDLDLVWVDAGGGSSRPEGAGSDCRRGVGAVAGSLGASCCGAAPTRVTPSGRDAPARGCTGTR